MDVKEYTNAELEAKRAEIAERWDQAWAEYESINAELDVVEREIVRRANRKNGK